MTPVPSAAGILGNTPASSVWRNASATMWRDLGDTVAVSLREPCRASFLVQSHHSLHACQVRSAALSSSPRRPRSSGLFGALWLTDHLHDLGPAGRPPRCQ